MNLTGKKRTMVQALFLDKGLYPSQEHALNWASANGFKTDQIVDDEVLWVFEQKPKSDFKMNAYGDGKDFQVVTVDRGIGMVIGELEEKALGHPSKMVYKSVTFAKVDDAKRMVTGPVLVPMLVDLQGDFEFAEDIEKAAHGFMEEARNIGEMHRKFGGIGVPVESWLLREPMFVDLGDEYKIYPAGTWMMSVKVTDDDVWEKVRDGELTGFSIGFRGTREEVMA